MTKRARPIFPAFDEAWVTLTREEREEAERLLLRYLELVVIIADEAYAEGGDAGSEDAAGSGDVLTAPLEDRTLALSGKDEPGHHYQP